MSEVRFGPCLSFAPHVVTGFQRDYAMTDEGDARFVAEVGVARKVCRHDLLAEEQGLSQTTSEPFGAVE